METIKMQMSNYLGGSIFPDLFKWRFQIKNIAFLWSSLRVIRERAGKTQLVLLWVIIQLYKLFREKPFELWALTFLDII